MPFIYDNIIKGFDASDVWWPLFYEFNELAVVLRLMIVMPLNFPSDFSEAIFW